MARVFMNEGVADGGMSRIDVNFSGSASELTSRQLPLGYALGEAMTILGIAQIRDFPEIDLVALGTSEKIQQLLRSFRINIGSIATAASELRPNEGYGSFSSRAVIGDCLDTAAQSLHANPDKSFRAALKDVIGPFTGCVSDDDCPIICDANYTWLLSHEAPARAPSPDDNDHRNYRSGLVNFTRKQYTDLLWLAQHEGTNIQDLLRTAYDEFCNRRFAIPDIAQDYEAAIERARLLAQQRREEREQFALERSQLMPPPPEAIA